MRIWQIVLIAGLLGVVAMFYKGLWQDPKAIPTVLIGTTAPEFSGPEVTTGETLSLEKYRGKVVMLNFWASWCFECKVEHDNVLAIHEQFKDNPDFVMLGVNYQDEVDNARKYLQTFGSTFNHVRDYKGLISIDYGVYGVPETFILDRQGTIRYKQVGPIVGEAYTKVTREVIEPLLQGESPSAL
jgi:cytochrome c biogenesis protein CcmG/thiol:disulfide interchange protein DsbE